ncbi:hypothetical protein E2562_028084 [Oryza meyeriana var. granulata]|uniref:Alpha-D-phosphohexomutase alpha/beta/alpha domain-containing protein n=1 Tax=Oryza meyeriana var. granulata TaxID=110450 RepID=A0A6G1C140_9ORYZ|nr:hypothetical protein E2562_028084 [Oryza meyeriana var. granulata]
MASHTLRLHPLLFSTAARPVPPKVRAGAQRSRPTLAIVRCSSAAQALKIKSILTNPVEGQKTRTSGLRQKVKMFQLENYLANWIQALFNSLPPEDYVGGPLVLGGDGRYFNKDAAQIITKIAAGNGVGKILVGRNGLLSTPAISTVIRKRQGTGSAGATIRVYNEQFESDASKHDLDAQIALRPLIEYEFQIWHHDDIGHESGDSNEEMNVNEEAPCVSVCEGSLILVASKRRGAGYVDHGDGHGSILMLDSSTEGEESLRGNIHRYHVGAYGANRWKSFEEVERPWWLIM